MGDNLDGWLVIYCYNRPINTAKGCFKNHKHFMLGVEGKDSKKENLDDYLYSNN